MKKKILILGGTKFVGRLLVSKLMEDNSYEIYLFNRGETNPNLFSNVNRIKGDRETDDINQIKNKEWDFVVDFSSFYPKSLLKTISNLDKGITKYIFISSISAYNFTDYDSSFEITENYKLAECSIEEAVDTTLKTYGKRKAECENILNKQEWLNKIILRPSIIYGEYDWSDRFYYWLYRVKKGHKFILPESGQQKLSLTYAKDFVKTISELIKSDINNGVYNCSTNEPISLKEIVQCMAIELNLDLDDLIINISQEWLLENSVKPQDDIPLWFGGHLMFDNQKIKKNLNIEFTDFRETVKKTIEFYNELKWYKPSIGLSKNKELETIEKVAK